MPSHRLAPRATSSKDPSTMKKAAMRLDLQRAERCDDSTPTDLDFGRPWFVNAMRWVTLPIRQTHSAEEGWQRISSFRSHSCIKRGYNHETLLSMFTMTQADETPTPLPARSDWAEFPCHPLSVRKATGSSSATTRRGGSSKAPMVLPTLCATPLEHDCMPAHLAKHQFL